MGKTDYNPYPPATDVKNCPKCERVLRHHQNAEWGVCPEHGVIPTPLNEGWYMDETVRVGRGGEYGLLRYRNPMGEVIP